jgi:DNA modification methylase
MNKDYEDFLHKKIVAAKSYGTTDLKSPISEKLLPHQRDIVEWAIKGGRRAVFASFGLGKTMMQLEIAKLVIEITGKPFLIGMPLGVIGEFKDDLSFLYPDMTLKYITDSDVVDFSENIIYCTNYERIRKGDIDPAIFGGVSFDEASIIRNLQTETTNYVLNHFSSLNYRFVATATPTPNDYIEILNYADYLGVIDRGHALTRFFQRDSTKAGHLTLYDNKKDEFWKWVATWAVFINKPSDLGYNDEGYNLPKLNFHEVEVKNYTDDVITNKHGDIIMFKDNTKSLIDVSREKSESVDIRVQKAFEIVNEKPNDNWVLWHHLEKERLAISKRFKDFNLKSVYGSQKNSEKEDALIAFKNGEYQILATKPKIAGSGCNFQHACFNTVFVGIDYKFNDFIQAIHRFYRFKQANEVNVYAIHTQNERDVLKALKAKWKRHIEQQTEMINLVREYGLNTDKIKSDMKRQIFNNRRTAKIAGVEVFNEDTTVIHEEMESNSTDMILTSIPFGDHYEYSDNYNDFGHNHGNEEFFKQMDFLTPNLLRTLKPGKVAAIHVKDRIRYSYQNGTSFTTIDDFSGKTVAHFQKHGFYLIGKITVTTDVVRENNQTYRLGWTEQCKDATKMGVGLPEYILLFRKAPTHSNNAYADEPCEKTKEEYTRANWQLDAHAYWRSDGNRFMSADDIAKYDFKKIVNFWKKHNKSSIYSFKDHLETCEILEDQGKLSSLFMTLPTHSNNELTWTDVNRMNTLNANQANRKKEKHICPLQLDIIDRLIDRFTMEGDLIDDPFGGLFSTAYKSMQKKRKCVSTELNPEYYDDGLYYLKAMEYKINVPTLFDML